MSGIIFCSEETIAMIKLFNKKSALLIPIIMCIFLMVGCSGTSGTSGKTSNKNKSDDSSSNGNSESVKQNNSQNELLKSIQKLAEEGKVIDCDFSAKNSVLSEVEKSWGKADKIDYVEAAKGRYATYLKYNVVFGLNKGDQIFEVRSFNTKIKGILLLDVKNFFGTPEYDAKTNNQEIIGYKSGSDFKLEFVFPLKEGGNSSPTLDHYCVLYPAGTVNIMASDPGRKW